MQRGGFVVTLLAVMLVTFAWHSRWFIVKYRGRWGDALWLETEGWVGIGLIGLVLLRLIIAALRREPRFSVISYLALCGLSPLWIPLLFRTVLAPNIILI